MSEASDNTRKTAHEKRIESARKEVARKSAEYQKMLARRERFLESNDKRVDNIRKKYDQSLERKRKRTDERIAENRKKISQNKNLDPEKRKRLEARQKRNEDIVAAHRKRKDAAIKKHRDGLADKRRVRDEKVKKYVEEEQIKRENRLKRIIRDKNNLIQKKRIKVIIITVIVLFFTILMIERVMPGSKLKKAGVIDDTPIEEELDIPDIVEDTKEYAALDGISENQLLWNLLMEHFDGNKTAVLGVMCNLNSESRLTAVNLEDYNNQLWGIDDEAYTERVNRKTIDKTDFTQSRADNVSNGYYNKYNQWVNKDGGYGYAQYTSFEKKQELYQYAETWFGPGGEGENYKFNIGDPTMQAHFIIYLLESPEYQNMDYMIRNAQNVVDACYYWLKMYEIPYDPYNDNYFTLAFDRAAVADSIQAACDN